MKVTRYLALTLVFFVILAGVGWFLRDTLIRRISNPLLQQYDITVTSVSLDTLATRDAHIGYLQLEHSNGTVIELENLSLPIVGSSTGRKTYRASKVSIITADIGDKTATPLAQYIEQFLALPETLAGTEILIDALDMPPYPVIHHLRWNLDENRQALGATIDSIEMSATITRIDPANHQLVLSLPNSAEADQEIYANLRQDDAGFVLNGEVAPGLKPWMPVIALADVLPDGIALDAATTGLQFSASIPFDTSLSAATAIEWSLRMEQAKLLVNYDDWRDIPVTVSGLMCKSGPVCSLNFHISMADAKLPVGAAARIEVTARDAHFAAVATPASIDSSWQFTAKSIDTQVEALALSEEFAINASVLLDDVVAATPQQTIEMHAKLFSPSTEAVLARQVVSLPGFRGEVSLQGEKFAAQLESVGLNQDGKISVQHNLQSGRGEMSISGAGISFAGKTLSKRVTPWPHDFDLSSGSVSLDLDSQWESAAAPISVNAQADVTTRDLAGFYTDTVFTGLSTKLDLTFSSDTGLAAAPSSITIALIEMGLPVEDIKADYTLDADELAADVENLNMSVFGGHVWADPFSFHTGKSSNNLTLYAESIELSELLTTNEFAAIEVTGTIAAVLPMTLEEDGITIIDGRLTGEPPGGVIRYLPGGMSDAADNSSLGLVNLALSNFQYESLTSDVDYRKDGELKLQMQLKGRNPDMQESRPVVLNLGVESNVRQMLRSLQAARAVEDILEKHLQQ